MKNVDIKNRTARLIEEAEKYLPDGFVRELFLDGYTPGQVLYALAWEVGQLGFIRGDKSLDKLSDRLHRQIKIHRIAMSQGDDPLVDRIPPVKLSRGKVKWERLLQSR